MRSDTLPAAYWALKFSCTAVHAAALPVESTRPETTKSECTPPSRVPLDVNLKRASRMGPFADRKVGTTLLAPKAVARATCGFTAGAEPPWVGKAWQPTQMSRSKPGHRPLETNSSSLKVAEPLKNMVV